jgi:ribosomal protein S27AE
MLATLLHQLSARPPALFSRVFVRAAAICPRCGDMAREHVGWADNMMVCGSCGYEKITD